MTHIVSRHLRIIPNESDADAQADAASNARSRGRKFDYASLLGRRRAPHRLTSDADAQSGGGPNPHAADASHDEDDGSAGAASPGADNAASNGIAIWDSEPESSAQTDATSEAAAASSPERQALRARVTHAAAPVVSAVYQQQQRFLQLLGSLAREIGGFCGDPSIAEAGNWEVQLPLDPKLLPHTTLYLTLSRFSLQLRFDTPDIATKQLLLEHSALLERELDTMLRAWGEARDIELTVW
ncbi:type III secretion protein [Trinickia violacea]|uniref:Type III secretion protein n=1 Tax=Trinickia violacea TaxID=2571746 RepID=A0A4P8IVM3_9BURK|nr:type III secretion system protein SctP [Trinickia violacea]QCP52297.1 type III secretion protein [Trinickia violacea]